MMICGRFDTLSPPKASTLITLSTVNRSIDCPRARLDSSTSAAIAIALRVDNDAIGCYGDAGKGFGEGVDDVGVEFRSRATPQLLQRLGRWPRAAVRARRRHR